MKKILSYQKKTFRFKRWNRAGYSAFMSLGKQISIAHVHTEIADALLRDKHLRRVLLPSFGKDLCAESDEQEKTDDDVPLDLLETLQLVCPVTKSILYPASRQQTYLFIQNPIFLHAKSIGFLISHQMKKIHVLCAAALLSGACYAQSSDTLSVNVSKVEVTKQATSLASESLRIVTTLSKEDIAGMPVQSINDLLDYIPGIDVRTRGGNGVQADLSMRGGTFDQVIVLLNGINITDPQTGHQTLDIPIDLSVVDRIEILQGTSMNVFGLSSFSGAINIITGTNKSKAVDAGITGGSNGYFAPHIGVTTGNDSWNITASASTNQSSGYINNTDYNYTNMYVQSCYTDSTIGTCKLQIGSQLKDFGANSFYSSKYPNQYEKDKTLLTSLQWIKQIRMTELSAAGFYRIHYDEFHLFRDMENAPTWYKKHNYHISQVMGGNAKISQYSKFGKSTLGVELRDEQILSNVLGDKLAEPQRVPFTQESDSIFFIYNKNRVNVNCFGEQTFVAGKMTASLGFSGNYNSMFRSNICWGGNIGYKIMPNLRLYANANSALRLPTFTDMYYKSATQQANPNLKPEKSLTFEAGTQWQSERLFCRLSSYYRIGSDIIDWARTTDDEVWKSMNIDHVNAFGIECATQYIIDKWFKSIGFTYAYCKLNKDSGERISKYALDYLHNSATVTVTHSIYKHFGAQWQLCYHDRLGSYMNTDNIETNYEPFALLDLQAYWQKESAKIFVNISNILNTTYYDYGGIEQPGRQYAIGISLHLAEK